jgi:beta-xylosidase
MTRARVAALALCALVLTGCAAGQGAGEPSASPTDDTAPGASIFAIDADFPDPDVIAVGDGYAAFATGSHGLNIRYAASDDLKTWTADSRDALPRLPAWASPGRTWAPDVAEGPDGGYLMYVTAEHTASGRQCIGVAAADAIDGEFAPVSDEPLVCPVDEGGAIDAATFDDADGMRYLLWKTDGNCCGQDTWIEIAPLSADGRALAGEPVRLLKQTLDWEGALIEAPVLVQRDARYVLFYSANDYGNEKYAVGAAVADDLMGPYEKLEQPVLASDGSLRGPGGQDVVETADGDAIVFHSWDELFIYRGLVVRPLEWDDGVPRVGD